MELFDEVMKMEIKLNQNRSANVSNLVNFYLQENRNQKVQILLILHIYLVTLEFLHKTHRSTTLVHAYVISDDLA